MATTRAETTPRPTWTMARGNSGCRKAAKISVDIWLWMPDSHHFLCWGHLSRRPTSSMATAATKTARLLSSAHATCTYPAKTMSWCAGPVYSGHIGRVWCTCWTAWASLTHFLCCVRVGTINKIKVIFCGLRFCYVQSHSIDSHMHPTDQCSAHALTQAHPTISCIMIYDKCIHIGYIQVCCNSYTCMPQGSSESNPVKQVHALIIIMS